MVLYKIVDSDDHIDLAIKVNAEIKQGYKPIGGPFIIPISYQDKPGGVSDICYAQAMLWGDLL